MISLSDIYDKNISLLLGSGASSGLFPTLDLRLTKDGDQRWSLEDLASRLEETRDARYTPLFMHYYASCIRPAQVFNLENIQTEEGRGVASNYKYLLETILGMLHRRPAMSRRCNVFTTNYDGCIPLVADSMLRTGAYDFVLNDGTRGFRQRILQARNFDAFYCQTGVFERHQVSVPQINLIHLHGSVYWKKFEDVIEVSYAASPSDDLLNAKERQILAPFSAALMNAELSIEQVPIPKFGTKQLDSFWSRYKKIPVVNPTKWKFHETLYEEHYYQMLRLLSYELEKPSAVLIVFGFSFRDEHILNLVKRSLANPQLQVFVCCHTSASYERIASLFRQHQNVKCLVLGGDEEMSFTEFNNRVLLQQPSSSFSPYGLSAAMPKPAAAATGDSKVSP